MNKNCTQCNRNFNALKTSTGRPRSHKQATNVKYCCRLCRDLALAGQHGVIPPKHYCENKHTKKLKYIDSKGYLRIRPPKNLPYINKNRDMYEHIAVMEIEIGRKITPSEVVHHVNSNKLDNRKENLLLLTRREHLSIHKSDIILIQQKRKFFKEADIRKEGMKFCTRCHRKLPLNNFYKDKKNPLGLKSYCKTCSDQYHTAYITKIKIYNN